MVRRRFLATGVFGAGLVLLAGLAVAQVLGPVPLVGSGGAVSTSGGYRIHTFASSGTFTPPVGVSQVDVLVVGGGGGGAGGNTTVVGGGGGAGRVVERTGVSVTGGAAINVTVGSGGNGGTGTTQAQAGGDSVFGAQTAPGGGRGGGPQALTGGAGGSGGGGAGPDANNNNPAGGGTNAGTPTAGAGNTGGAGIGVNQATRRAAGGGGGASLAGGAATQQGNSDGVAGSGGAGITSTLFGGTFGAGGGGSSGGADHGAGGSGGLGGAGGATSGGAGAANTGSGGGGARNGTGGAGGSGIVIVRYLPPTLELTQEPAAATDPGTPFGQPFQVTLLDGSGSGVNGVTITATINSATGPGTLSNATASTDANGVATFTGLTISDAGDYSIAFSPNGATEQVVSNTVTVNEPVTRALSISQQPSAIAQNDVEFASQPVISAVDSESTPANGLQVTAALVSGNGTLTGTTSVLTDSAGDATFTDLAITGGSGNHEIEFTASGWDPVTSQVIDVQQPALIINQQPSPSVVSGDTLDQQPVISVQDVYGNPVSGVQVTVAIASGGGTLGGTTTVTSDGAGLATYTDLSITGTAGDRTLQFTAAGWDPVTSATITVTDQALDPLVITTQPSATAQSGIAFAQQPVIDAVDGDSNPVSGLDVTAAIVSGGGTLSGTVTQTTDINGQATFTDLQIDGAAGDRVLRFSAPDWDPADSDIVTLSEPPLVISQQPSASIDSGDTFPQQPVILVQDVYGNPVSGVQVTAAVNSGGGTLGGTTTATSDGSGLATFTDLSLTGTPGSHDLVFTAPTWTGVVSNTITIEEPDALAITTQPSATAQNGIVFQQQPVVTAIDSNSNPVSGVQITAAILSGGGTLDGTVTVTTDANGVGTFTDLAISGTPGDRVLQFTATDWEPVDSDTISVTEPPLTINTQPSATATSGIVFAQQPVIEVLDVYGDPVSGVNVSATVNTGSGTLSGTTTVTSNSSGLASFSNLAINGSGDHTLAFDATDWTSVASNTISVQLPPDACQFEGGLVGSQRVELLGCTEVQVVNAGSVDLPVPAGTAAGDLLVAAFSGVGNGNTATAPAGWTTITAAGQGGGNPGSRQNLTLMTRVADGSEPASYTVAMGQTEDAYAFMMRFGGSSGTVLTATESVSSGTDATAPSLTTNEDDSLVVRFAAVNGGGSMTVNPATIIAGHRNITQNNGGDAFGSAAYYNQETAGPSGTANFTNTNTNWVTQTIAIEPEPITTHFEISHADNYALCTDGTPVTITLRDSLGNTVTDYEGTVTISNSGGFGDYAISSGSGTLDNLTAGDGEAVYDFDVTDNGQVILEFSASAGNNQTITFDANDGPVGTENYALQMQVGDCSFSITHDGQGGTCSATPVTVSVLGPDGNPVVDYDGQFTLATTQGSGDWSSTFGGSGTFDNGAAGDGEAQYTFAGADDGVVRLGYSNTAGTYDFTISSDTGDVPTTSANDGDLVVSACAFRVSHDGAASVCLAEPVTIQVVNASGVPVTGYSGTANLSTAGTTGGNWSKTGTPSDATGTLAQGTPNTGSASYSFTAADEGEIILDFKGTVAETVNFNITASGVAAPSAPYDDDLVIGACTFRIEHSGSSDVCSVESVTITLVDADGNAATGYTGTVNLSTTSGYGTWSETATPSDANGTLNDPVPEDGNATYAFVAGDDGSVTLGFTQRSATGSVNLNVSDGTSQDARNSADPYDQSLSVANCTFEISLGGDISACEVGQVSLLVRNSSGNVATDFAGTVNLFTDTNSGNWYIGDGQGTLSGSGGDNGVAEYEFAPGAGGDNGEVTLDFVSLLADQINFDAESTVITEDGNFDPTLTITSCLPGLVGDAQCTNPRDTGLDGRTTTLSIPGQAQFPEQRGRMVLMATALVGTETVNEATFGPSNTDMQLIRREVNTDGPGIVSELWGILDTDLPAAAGTYSGGVTPVAGNGSPDMAICLLAVDQAEQVFPTENGSNPEAGPLNSTTRTTDPGNNITALEAATTISTQTNNALVVGLMANDHPLGIPGPLFLQPQPALIMDHIFGGSDGTPLSNPVNGRFGGAAGRQAGVGVVTVAQNIDGAPDDDPADEPTVNTHIVAAFSPLIAGSPEADDYDPVVLHETFAGNMSYVSIGNSLRDRPTPQGSVVDPAEDCSFVDFATGTEASLALPAGSTVAAAYLYWGGSGTEADIDQEVTFGPAGSEIVITADGTFLATGLTPQLVDFFAAFKEVTGLVSGSGDYTLRDLEVQAGTPWSSNGTCAGGWSLLVVYENPDERLRVLNLFHGLQPFQNSSFTLVPRNFRMATYDLSLELPNGQVTHVTMEGDEQPLSPTVPNPPLEGLGIQTAPDSTDFNFITSGFNPSGNEFNSTITRPIYSLESFADGTYWAYDETAGTEGDGYELDFPCVPNPDYDCDGPRIGSTWGWDVDTHYIGPDLLEQFSQPGDEAERITTQYASGQDLVVLLSEIISVTNFPLADIEIFKRQIGDFKVGGTGTYEIEVTNNGNGSAGGDATGFVVVADRLPPGMTLASAGDVGGTDWSCTVQTAPDPGRFTCTYDIAANQTLLAAGDSLPDLTVTVQIGEPPAFFPQLDNNVKNVARVIHTGGNCTLPAVGYLPDEDDCDRSPQYDNVFDLEGGSIDVNTVNDKSETNNNVDSVTTNVRGIETDLRMQKEVVDILETGETAQYRLTVTNLGPDATTVPFSVTDAEPDGVSFTGWSGAGSNAGDWSCTVSPDLVCSFNGTLAVGQSAEVLIDMDVVGAQGFVVTNTALVEAGQYNFDTNAANDAATDITTIVGPPVASQERFLLSVSTPGDDTSIGGLNNFSNDDLIIYDPATDEADMYFDPSSFGHTADDINAVHLLKNGHIVFSVNAQSTVDGVTFDPWDLLVWDPILEEAELFLDGEDIFGATGASNFNIDAVFVMEDESVLFSTVNGGTIGTTTFSSGDILRYDPGTGTTSVYLESTDSDVFGDPNDVNVDAFYQRVDPADPQAVIDVFVLSADDESAIIGADGAYDPPTGTIFTRDDVTELNRVDSTTENLFVGDVELGVFEPDTAPDDVRRLDALHLVEDGYIGHFSITRVSTSPNACEPTVIRISKHRGLTHNRDTGYEGSIEIATSTGQGKWSIQSASGNLIEDAHAPGDVGDGQAIYTFVDADDGTVLLRLEHDAASVNIEVTNRIARELGSEDPTINVDPDLTPLLWADDFSEISYSNKTGDSQPWAGPWVEVDANGGGASSGNVFINDTQNRLSMTSSVGAGANQQITREIDFDAVPYSEEVVLRFRYGYANLASTDNLLVEVRGTSADSWLQVTQFTGLSGSLAGPLDFPSGSYTDGFNLSQLLTANGQDFSDTTQIRFRIANGYELDQRFYLYDVGVETATDECGFDPTGNLDHYAISFSGPQIACTGTYVTIAGHDAGHNPIDPNETITLTTSSSQGRWSRVLSGTGLLQQLGGVDDGQASYTFPAGESSATLWFNYTDVPPGGTASVNINVQGQSTSVTESIDHDPQLVVAEAGLRFWNATQGTPLIRTQIAGKPSSVAPRADNITLQAVRTSDNDPSACAPLFAPGQVLNVGLAAERADPATGTDTGAETFTVTNNGTTTPIALNDGNGGSGVAGYQDVALLFEDQGGFPAAELVLEYSDVGDMQLHASFDIPFGFFGTPNPDDPLDPGTLYSGDLMTGSSNNFVVRPFGFAIDFDDSGSAGLDRETNGQAGDSWSTDSGGSVWRVAGESFDIHVTSMGWQAGDDLDNDGVPDGPGVLHDNRPTPSFFRDVTGTTDGYQVAVSVDANQAEADGGVAGVLGNATMNFNDFDSSALVGSGTRSMTYDEVGIIDLSADLVDTNGNPATYLGTDPVTGQIGNLGRFIPARFVPTGILLTSRVEQSCTPASDFTYMGEPFGMDVTLRAENLGGDLTVNYRSGFAKLTTREALNFTAVEADAVNGNTEFGSRIDDEGMPTGFAADWAGGTTAGELDLSGSLVFTRNSAIDNAEDGPFEDMTIAFRPEDSDGVTLDTFDVDDEAGDPAFLRLDEHEFRYGRLLIDNAYGPETEDLAILFRVEYYDGERFVVNRDDSCTLLDVTDELSFVSGTWSGNLDAGDTVLQLPDDTTFHDGRTQGVESASNPTDAPFATSAPGEGNDGSVDVELDLTEASGLDLEFLQYRWRDDASAEFDGHAQDPRALLEFGRYRGHDLIISIQEIYNRPTQE